MATFILKNRRFVIFFILIISFFLRLYHLGYHDLWYDEVITVILAQHPLYEILNIQTPWDSQKFASFNYWYSPDAPLYCAFLHFWIKIFGISEFSLRFISLVFNFLSVALVFILGKKIFNLKVGTLASIFMGLSPFHLWYSQEVRDYSMLIFLGLLSTLLFYNALKEDRNKFWLFFILTSIVGFYTNYFYSFLFLTQILYLIFFKKLKLNFKDTSCFLIIFLFLLPYLNKFLCKFFYVWGGFWIAKPTWWSLIITLENFVLGYNGFHFLYLISNILAGVFFISTLLAIRKKDLRDSFIFCMFLFFIPIICVFLFAKLFFPIYLDRSLIVFSPYFYLIMSLGIISLNRSLKIASLIILISIILIADYRYFKDWIFMPSEHRTGVFIKKPFKPIVKFIESNLKEEDIIGVTNINPAITPSLSFYSSKNLFFYFFFSSGMIDTNWQRPVQEAEYYIPLYKIDRIKFKRLWIISTDGGDRSGGLDKNSQLVKNWLDNNLKLKFSKEFDGLWLFIYEY